MSRFYGSMKGERKTRATKGAQRELSAHIRTWDHGILVHYRDAGSHTVCEVWETAGSNRPVKVRCIRRFKIDNDKAPNRRPGFDYIGGIGNEVCG